MSKKQIDVDKTLTSVAVKYQAHQDAVPRVVAKGKRQLAEKIVKIAKSSGIPVIGDELLTQLLYQLEVGKEIPEELYTPVAKILAFIYKVYKQQFAQPVMDIEQK